MMRDCEQVFEKEPFYQFSEESIDAMYDLMKGISKNIDVLVPRAEQNRNAVHKDNAQNYKRLPRCRNLKLSKEDTLLNLLPKSVALAASLEKIDTNAIAWVEVCNNGTRQSPTVNAHVGMYRTIKGDYSYHLIHHNITMGRKYKANYQLESITDGLYKLDTLRKGMIYRIWVSPEIGFFD